MAAPHPAIGIRCLGIIKTVNTNPPSVVIIPAIDGPLVTSTDFTPAQLSTMLLALSFDMRQVTYLMRSHANGRRAEEVMCVGEVPSTVKEDETDHGLLHEGSEKKKKKKAKCKGNAIVDDSKLIGPAPRGFRSIEEKWSKEGMSHEVSRSKPDPIMGQFLRQEICRSHKGSSETNAADSGT